MLKKTRARLASSPHRSKLKIIQHDLTLRWPFPDASVDLVFGDLVLEHLEKVEPFYAQAANIIKQGGTLFICEYHPYRQYKVVLRRFTLERFPLIAFLLRVERPSTSPPMEA